MSNCTKIGRPKREVCIGSMSNKITLYVRKIAAPDFNDIDYGETLEEPRQVWAMVKTSRGETVFDKANLEQDITHRFYIRYISDVTFQDWLLFKDRYYNIVDVENLENRDEFLLLRCNLRGDKNTNVNLS
jgi:SPP1 family predicted phage head-tail adaptor